MALSSIDLGSLCCIKYGGEVHDANSYGLKGKADESVREEKD